MQATRLNLLRLTLLAALSAVTLPVLAAAPFPAGDYTQGDLTLHFGNDGKFTVSQTKGGVVVEGAYASTADEVKLTDKSGPWACLTKGTETGSYGWTVAKEALTLTRRDDRCDERANTLLAGPWQRAR